MFGQWSSTRCTATGEITSPPVNTSCTVAKISGASSATTRNRPAVRSSPVTWPSTNSRRRVLTSRLPSGATTVVPPFNSGTQIA